MEILKEAEVVKNVANILKTNNISGAVAQHGESVLKQPLVKGMRGVKREILTLISTWVGKADDPQV
uniref:Exportin-1 C-terminal domain-containing protein n=1 Tax=Plectus sambesii TaxID=2011161 RepID=A0A914VE97_9BILA